MRWCENHRVDYVPGFGRNKVLERRIDPLMADAQAAFDKTGEKQRHFVTSNGGEHLAETELAAAQTDQLRLSLVKIAARVCLSTRRVVFHLSSNCPYQSLFRAAAASLLLDTG
jgi:hypothetical protein